METTDESHRVYKSREKGKNLSPSHAVRMTAPSSEGALVRRMTGTGGGRQVAAPTGFNGGAVETGGCGHPPLRGAVGKAFSPAA